MQTVLRGNSFFCLKKFQCHSATKQDRRKFAKKTWQIETRKQFKPNWSAKAKMNKAGPHRARRGTALRFCYSTKQGEKRICCGHKSKIYQRKPIALPRRERERARCGSAFQVKTVERSPRCEWNLLAICRSSSEDTMPWKYTFLCITAGISREDFDRNLHFTSSSEKSGTQETKKVISFHSGTSQPLPSQTRKWRWRTFPLERVCWAFWNIWLLSGQMLFVRHWVFLFKLTSTVPEQNRSIVGWQQNK